MVLPVASSSFQQQATYETYTPLPHQALFHSAKRWSKFNKLMKGAVGGLGSGKSTACVQEFIDVCFRTPGGVSLALRESLPRSETSLIEDLGMYLGKHAICRKNKFILPNGHKIIVAPADKWDRFGSTQFVAVFAQEAQEMKWKIISTLFERLRHPAGVVDGFHWFRLFFDARGVESTHWVVEKFIGNAWDIRSGIAGRLRVKKPWYVYQRFRTADNREHLPEGYEEDLRQEHADDPIWCKVMLDGEIGYSMDGRGAFEHAYDPEQHDVVSIEPDPALPLLRAWDFGYYSPVVLWCQYTRDGRLLVLREFVPGQMAREQVLENVRQIQYSEFPAHVGPYAYRDFGDIAGDQQQSTGITDIDFFQERLETAFEGLRKDHVEPGLDVIRGLMSRMGSRVQGQLRPQLLVAEQCVILREAFRGGLYYEEEKEGKPLTKKHPYRDVVDALRYLAQAIIAEEPEGASYSYSRGGAGSPGFAVYSD